MKTTGFWLAKTEPDVYSIDDFARDGTTEWDGVRNYQVRDFMRDHMRPDQKVLIYHSNAKPLAVVGVAEVAGPAHPDSTQFDPDSRYYDARSDPGGRIRDHPEAGTSGLIPSPGGIHGLEACILTATDRKDGPRVVDPSRERR